jgi:hypothetical protein
MGLLRECEAAAEGLLVERLTGDLGFDPPSKRYNRGVDLTLDYDSGHIAPILEPTDDDQLTRNDVTVTRTGGGFATSVDEDGPLGIDTVGRYDDSPARNIASVGRLRDHASWLLALGTVDELRWPHVVTNLRRNYALVDAWLTCDIGSRIALTTLPDLVSYDPADLFIEGYGEFMDPVTWDVELNCAPASPHEVAAYGSATDPDATGTHRYDTAGSELAASFVAGTDTSMSVATTLGQLWSTVAGRYPLDIRCGGVVLTVTAVSGASSPQTFTITQTPVSGPAKTIPSGTSLRLASPARYGI